MSHRLRITLSWLVLVVFGLDGCTAINRWLPPHPAAAAVAPVVEKTADTGRDLLDDLARLQVDSASTQAELVAAARAAAETAPTVANRLRYAAFLGVPHHPSSDAPAARRQLAELLAQPELLRPSDRILAKLLLVDVEERLVLQSEADRLRVDLSAREKDHGAAPPPKRTPAEAEEIGRLKRALEEAQRKLDAVTEAEKALLGRRSPANH